jgi:deazaflavin-dependent oxidoreductase (nitroreductase family)
MSPKSLTVSNQLARFNRRITNPIVRIFAGRRLSPVAIVVHRGRTSGRHYRTPVVAFATDDGYLVSLPYGAERDWVRNVLAAGSCTLERAGQRIPLIEPTLLGQREGTAQLRWPVRKGLRLLRVKAVLMLSADPIVADTHH